MAESEYLQIEEFIARTPRGRAFLREHSRRSEGTAVHEVRALVGELRDLWQRQSEATNLVNRVAVLRHELQDMSASISQARREIAAIKPADDQGKDRIVSATNELDAIILSTERASSEILGAAERILELLARLREGGPGPELASEIEDQVMTIFTSCSFQDLTGQRTTKVINALRYIEQRIATLIALWGVSSEDSARAPAGPEDKRPDAHLLNGPSADGNSQDEIDRLMSGFGGAAPGRSAAPKASQAGVREAAAPVLPASAPADVIDAPPALDQSAVDALFG
ncbi:protein phosphatase CheZ [Arenibaculum pallidiluteum]|uniref:protein phosphatase CheZ n=1 Tax=Arenibaculum pallidiluteum TaxID=2812559 RepID=UPI001A95D1E8|nr:protein phosphatase CheZ [Arenibaculum pallidiluteum]